MRILIIEDEKGLTNALTARLKKENYIVDTFSNGREGLESALSGIYDLILLDVMLPFINGFDILKKVREKGVDSKIIMLTAKSELEDKLEGLENGANDYVTKPFHMDELIARINIQLRNQDAKKDYMEYFDIKLNLRTGSLMCTHTNEKIEVICKEFLILEYLMQNANQILSKEQIYDKIWGIDKYSESNNVEAYISFIRKKLRLIGSNVSIKAIRGLGYKLGVQDEKTGK